MNENGTKRLPPTKKLTVRRKDKTTKSVTVIAIWEERSWTIDKDITEEDWMNLYKEARRDGKSRDLYFNVFDPKEYAAKFGTTRRTADENPESDFPF